MSHERSRSRENEDKNPSHHTQRKNTDVRKNNRFDT